MKGLEKIYENYFALTEAEKKIGISFLFLVKY